MGIGKLRQNNFVVVGLLLLLLLLLTCSYVSTSVVFVLHWPWRTSDTHNHGIHSTPPLEGSPGWKFSVDVRRPRR